jgi:hypothetical protein
MTTFRHTIGDALYDLHIPYDDYLAPEETLMYTIVKRTAKFVYVRSRHSWERDKLIRFSVADLERTGEAWNAANRMLLHTRPMPNWPLMPAVVSKPDQLAIEP